MTEEEKLEFRALVSKHASEIVTLLMKSDLGSVDAGFYLGSALKLCCGVTAKLSAIPLQEAQDQLMKAFNAGYENTEAQIVVIGAADTKH